MKSFVTFSFVLLMGCALSRPDVRGQSKPSVAFTYDGPYTAAAGETISHTEKFEVPAGKYGKLTLEMDVTLGPWHAANPDAWHNLFWMVKNGKNRDMLGYAALRQPQVGVPLAMLRQGMGVPHAEKSKMMFDAKVAPGATCHLDYTYDVAGGSAVLVITSGGKEIARFNQKPVLKPAANALEFAEGDVITVGLSTAIGENKAKSPEAPSIGWTYRNLKVALSPSVEG